LCNPNRPNWLRHRLQAAGKRQKAGVEKPAAASKRQLPQTHRPVSGPVRFVLRPKTGFCSGTSARVRALIFRIGRIEVMLVERGLRVMSVEVVGDAYAIASNYLRQAGVISDSFVTNEQLLQIIVALFQRGECNKIRLANKAITQFEAELV
jgi:hypothetical protein